METDICCGHASCQSGHGLTHQSQGLPVLTCWRRNGISAFGISGPAIRGCALNLRPDIPCLF